MNAPRSTPRPSLTAPPVPPDGWQVTIRCTCGTVAGMVTAHPGAPWDVRLATSLPDFRGCQDRGCPPLRWPTEAEVQRAADRAGRRRTGRVRAHAATVKVYTADDLVMRGHRLGEGPEDVARRAGPDAIVRPFVP